jgi:Zn-dependent protease with chaperone function
MTRLWSEFFIALGVGAALLVFAAVIMGHFAKSATSRRTIWQSCFAGLGLLLCCELAGARWMAEKLFVRTEHRVTAAPKPQAWPSAPSARDSVVVLPGFPAQGAAAPGKTGIPRPKPQSAQDDPLKLWWPALAWLAGTLIVGTLAVGRRILLFLFRRRCAAIADPRVLAQVETLARQLGIKRKVHAIGSVRLISPIAFGALRPTICLPANFTELFTAPEQEAVLIHELAHVAARDPVWQGFADVIVALFWWHPLAWWAQHELRSSTEAAADETSLMLANGPKVLAECLVNLGTRFTDSAGFKALGIHGVRFRSGLGRRVQRLFALSTSDWKRPTAWKSRSAQFLAPAFCVGLIVVCGAWANTTKKGEHMKTWKQSLAGFAAVSLLQTLQSAEPPTKPNDGGLNIAATKPQGAPDARGGLGKPEKPSNVATNISLPKLADLNVVSRDAQLMRRKLENIVLDSVHYDGLPLGEVVKNLMEESRKRDPEKRGVNFVFAKPRFQLTPVIDPATGLPVSGAGEPFDVRSTTIRIEPSINNIRLIDIMEVIRKVADRPIEYTIHEYGVVFAEAPPVAPPGGAQVVFDYDVVPTIARTFKVDPRNFFNALKRTFGINIMGAQSADDLRSGLAQFLATLGVDINSPNRAVFYNELNGTLLVRASHDEMSLIEAAMETLGATASGTQPGARQ